MGTQLREHSKGQMEQVSKLTEAVTQLTSSNNVNKLAARSIADQENSDNSDSGMGDEENNRRKMTGCFIKLLSQLSNILKTNSDHKDEELQAIQTFLDGIKMSGHATQCNQIYYQ